MIVFLAFCGPAGFSQQYCSDEMWRNIKALNDLHYYMKVKLVSVVLLFNDVHPLRAFRWQCTEDGCLLKEVKAEDKVRTWQIDFYTE